MKKFLILCVLAFTIMFLQSCSSGVKQCAAYAKHQTTNAPAPSDAG